MILLMIAGVAVGGLAFRMSKGPIDVSFAKPYIKDAVREAKAGFAVDMDQVYLEWPELTGPILIGMGNLRLTGARGETILNVDSAGMGLSYPHLLTGRLRPTSLIIRGPTLRIDRTANGITLLLEEYELKNPEAQQDAAKPAASLKQAIALRLSELADNDMAKGTFFDTLDELAIEDARLIVHDRVGGVSRFFTSMNAAFARSAKGMDVTLSLGLVGRGEGESGITLALAYRKNAGIFALSANMRDVNPLLFGELLPRSEFLRPHRISVSGRADVVFDRTLTPVSATANLQSSQGFFSFEGEYDAPLTYNNAVYYMSYTKEQEGKLDQKLDITIAQAPVSVSSNARIGQETISFPLSLAIPEIKVDTVAGLIPRSGLTNPGGEWLGLKLKDGVYKDIAVEAILEGKRRDVVGAAGPLEPWAWEVTKTQASFGFEDLTVQYSDTLMPARKAKGSGVFDGEVLTIKGESGSVGDAIGSNIDMKFTDFLIAGGGLADITVDVKGPLPTFLSYLKDDPINLTQEQLGISHKTAKGELTAKVKLNFPTLRELPKEQVKVKIDGTMTGLSIPDMVQGLALSGGPLSLSVADGQIKVKGGAQLAGREVALDWLQHLDPAGKDFEMQVKALVGADRELRQHFGVDLEDFISGTLPVDILFTKRQDDSATLDLTGDLTPIKIGIEPFAYTKPSGVPGTVRLRGALQGEEMKRISALSIDTQDFKIREGELYFRTLPDGKPQIAGGKIPSALLGKTSQAVEFTVSQDDHWTVNASGAVFDAEPFLRDNPNKDRSADNPSFAITMAADTMLTKKQESIKKARLKVNLSRIATIEQMELDAFAGKGDIYLRYKPNAAGQRNFHMEATDAGATLKAFDIFRDVIGGKITVYGEPIGGNNSDDIYGTARMDDFKVVNAPAIARLVNAMSLTGLDAALQGEGLSFARLEGEFEWLFKPEGSRINVRGGRTSGSSLGLTFEGSVDRASGEMDMRGTIIPLSGLNNVLGQIPLVGDILTGGTGLIAATYTMTGVATEPKVAINPLSVLAPGFLRTILFEGGLEETKPEPGKNR